MSPDEPDVVAEDPRESRTAQFYQAHDAATHPLLARYGTNSKRVAQDVAAGRVGQDNPSPTPRLKVRLGGPTHTRVSALVRRTTVADTQ